MTTDLPTPPAPASTDFPTYPCLSQARADALAWYDRAMAQARPADQDAARFLRGLEENDR